MEVRSMLILGVLRRHFDRQDLCEFTFQSALYAASRLFLKGRSYKEAIRLGKRIIDNHYIWENE